MAASLVVRVGIDASTYKAGLTEAERDAKKFASESARAHKEAENAAKKSAESIAVNYGKSAKEINAAMRTVPAQFTDIVTSLQGGQNPFTVLLQQGGQLKDQFGGVGAASRALGGYIAGLVNPFSLAAAAAAALGVAYYQASKEGQNLAASIATTNNAAGTSVDKLNAMAEALDGTFGVTQGKGAEALAMLNSTGRIASSNLQEFAQVAIDAEKALGVPIEKTAEAFAKLAKEPSKASKEYNETLNYLTASVYKQILAAEELGQTEKAAAIAQQAYADAQGKAANQVNDNIGILQKAFRGLASVAKESWDAILGIGREDSIEEKIKDLEDKRNRLANSRGVIQDKSRVAVYDAEIAALKETQRLRDRSAQAEADRAAKEKAGIKEVDEAHKASIKARADAAREAAKEQEAFIKSQRQVAIDAGDAVNKGNEEYSKWIEKIKDKTPIDIQSDYRKEIEKVREAVKINRLTAEEGIQAEKALTDELNTKLAKTNEFANGLGLTFSSAFEDAIVAGKSFGDILKGVEADIIRLVVRLTVVKPLADSISKSISGASGSGGGIGEFFSGLFNGGTEKRASGGSVSAGGTYLVGEQGPEILRMGASTGNITPTHMAAQALGGGGSNVQVNIINNSGSQVSQTRRDNADGSTTIDVMIQKIEEGIASNVAAGTGAMSGALAYRYGLQAA